MGGNHQLGLILTRLPSPTTSIAPSSIQVAEAEQSAAADARVVAEATEAVAAAEAVVAMVAEARGVMEERKGAETTAGEAPAARARWFRALFRRRPRK